MILELGVDVLLEDDSAVEVLRLGRVVGPAVGKHAFQVRNEQPFVAVIASFLKSQVIPEGHRANVMNWFRVPMNMIMCGALLSLHADVFAQDKRIMFMMCLGLSILGIVICSTFSRIMAKPNHIVDLSSDRNEKASLLADHESDI